MIQPYTVKKKKKKKLLLNLKGRGMITADPKLKSILNYNNVAESTRMRRNFLLSKEQRGDKACSTDLSKTSQDHGAQNLPLYNVF